MDGAGGLGETKFSTQIRSSAAAAESRRRPRCDVRVPYNGSYVG